jgi:hypothetical protein
MCSTLLCDIRVMCLTVCFFVRDVEKHNEMYHNKVVLNLLQQQNAQYYIYLDIKDVTPTCFGTSVPSSESSICQV